MMRQVREADHLKDMRVLLELEAIYEYRQSLDEP
jgi:hypothetical protein